MIKRSILDFLEFAAAMVVIYGLLVALAIIAWAIG